MRLRASVRFFFLLFGVEVAGAGLPEPGLSTPLSLLGNSYANRVFHCASPTPPQLRARPPLRCFSAWRAHRMPPAPRRAPQLHGHAGLVAERLRRRRQRLAGHHRHRIRRPCAWSSSNDPPRGVLVCRAFRRFLWLWVGAFFAPLRFRSCGPRLITIFRMPPLGTELPQLVRCGKAGGLSCEDVGACPPEEFRVVACLPCHASCLVRSCFFLIR